MHKQHLLQGINKKTHKQTQNNKEIKQESIFFLLVYNLTSRSNSLTKFISDIFLLCMLCNQTSLDISNNEHVAITIKSYKSR